MTTRENNPEIRRFQRSVGRALMLRRLVAWASIWLVAAGTVVLALRIAAGVSRDILLLGTAAGLPVVAALACIRRRALPSGAAVRAFLDDRNRCGGLFMADAETPLGDWRDRVPVLQRPHVRWHARKPVTLLICAVLYTGIALSLPKTVTDPAPVRRLEVDTIADDLRAQIELLNEEEVVDDTLPETLEDELERVREKASGTDPVTAWETLDSMDRKLDQLAQETAQSDVRASDALARGEALSAALGDALDRLSDEALREGMSELESLFDQAAQEHQNMTPLTDAMRDQLQSATMSAAQLRELADSLGQVNQQLRDRLSRLAEAGLIDEATLEAYRLLSTEDLEAMQEALQGIPGEELDGAALLAAAANCNRPGRGGVTRGRGDAAMTWRDPASEENVDFTPESLPPGAFSPDENAALVGISAAAPELSDEDAGASASGALGSAASGGGTAATPRILPQHRRTVERYFDRQ